MWRQQNRSPSPPQPKMSNRLSRKAHPAYLAWPVNCHKVRSSKQWECWEVAYDSETEIQILDIFRLLAQLALGKCLPKWLKCNRIINSWNWPAVNSATETKKPICMVNENQYFKNFIFFLLLVTNVYKQSFFNNHSFSYYLNLGWSQRRGHIMTSHLSCGHCNVSAVHLIVIWVLCNKLTVMKFAISPAIFPWAKSKSSGIFAAYRRTYTVCGSKLTCGEVNGEACGRKSDVMVVWDSYLVIASRDGWNCYH